MRFLLPIVVLLALAVVGQAAIVELTKETFLSEVAVPDNDDTWLVLFYGVNCGFCKSMKPYWEELADEIEAEGLDYKLGQLDVHAEGTGQEMYYYMPGPLPGVHLFEGGRFYQMGGARYISSMDTLLDFVLFGFEDEKVTSYPVDKNNPDPDDSDAVAMGEDFDEATLEGRYLLFFFGPKCGWCKKIEPIYNEFATLMKDDDSLVVAKVNAYEHMSLTQRFSARPWPSIVLLEKENFWRVDTDIVRENDASYDYLVDFVNGGYEEVGEEFRGVNEGRIKYLKKKAALERSRAKKAAKQAKDEL